MKLLLLVLLALAPAAHAANDETSRPAPVNLFAHGPNDAALPAPNFRPAAVGVLAEHPVAPNVRALAAAGARARLTIPLPTGRAIVLQAVRFDPVEGFVFDERFDAVPDPNVSDDQLTYHWYGVGRGMEASLTVHRGLLVGRIVNGAETYAVSRALGQPILRTIQAGAIPLEPEERFPIAKNYAPPTYAPDAASARPKFSDRLNVLVLFTQNAIIAAGDQATLEAQIANAVASMNTALGNSHVVSVYINHVGSVFIGYDELNNCFNEGGCTALRQFEMHKRFVRNDVDIQALRNQFEADFVVTFVGDGTRCGVAYTQRPDCGFSVNEQGQCGVGDAYNAFAYSIVSAQPACENWNFAHEAGHQLGLEHEPATAAAAGTASFLWSYGHSVSNQQAQARDVMASTTGCIANFGGCPLVFQYSNPFVDFVTFPGTPSGTNAPEAGGITRFNARTSTLLSDEVANFRGEAITDRIFRSSIELLPDML